MDTYTRPLEPLWAVRLHEIMYHLGDDDLELNNNRVKRNWKQTKFEREREEETEKDEQRLWKNINSKQLGQAWEC